MTPAAAFALQAGLQVGGAVIASTFGKPQVPDYVTPAIESARDNIRQSQEMMQSQQRALESQMASSGITGFGGVNARERLMRVAAGEQASTRASIMDRVNQARMMQIQTEVAMQNQELQQRRQMIMNAFNAGSTAVGAYSQQQQLDQRREIQEAQRLKEQSVNPWNAQVEQMKRGEKTTYDTPAYANVPTPQPVVSAKTPPQTPQLAPQVGITQNYNPDLSAMQILPLQARIGPQVSTNVEDFANSFNPNRFKSSGFTTLNPGFNPVQQPIYGMGVQSSFKPR
jgi:hypothetical protein